MGAHVTVSPSVLKWATQRSGNPILIYEKFKKLSKWLNGETYPTLHELELFAKATYTPLGYLFLNSPPIEEITIPHYRTISQPNGPNQLSPNLIETIQIMEERQDWMRDFLSNQHSEPLSFVNSVKIEESDISITSKIREVLGINALWAAELPNWEKALQFLRESIENAGVMVFRNGIVGENTHRKLDVSEFRGFVLIDEYAPLIFINSTDSKAAQMFTLAHEIAHIFLGKSAIFDLKGLEAASDPYEQKCNSFAAEFLVPKESLLELLKNPNINQNKFQLIAKTFKVSEIVAVYRLLNLKLIHKEEFDTFYFSYITKNREKLEHADPGGDYYATQKSRLSQRFSYSVICAAREGKLLYRDAYRLIGMYGNRFDRYANHIGCD